MTSKPHEASSRTLTCRISRALEEALEHRRRETGESREHIVRAALSDYLQVEHATLFQVSTVGALVEGLYQGEVTIAALREHGDFGLGTFEGLDGEMVVLEGRVYQVKGDGSVYEASDSARSPFAVVTHFPPSPEVRPADCSDLDELKAQLDRLRDSENVAYAIRIDGEFTEIATRSIRPTPEGVPLAEAASRQNEFRWNDRKGTLVGFWSPGYMSSVLVPGYHLHFLSDDRRSGGHLLACGGRGLVIRMARLDDFRISLPESAAFLHADLTRDTTEDLRRAETQSKPE